MVSLEFLVLAPPDLKLKNNEKIQAYQNLHQNHPIEEHKMNYNQ